MSRSYARLHLPFPFPAPMDDECGGADADTPAGAQADKENTPDAPAVLINYDSSASVSEQVDETRADCPSLSLGDCDSPHGLVEAWSSASRKSSSRLRPASELLAELKDAIV